MVVALCTDVGLVNIILEAVGELVSEVIIAELLDIEGVVKFPSTVRARINLAFEYFGITITPM
jgi:hypothetical protein